MINDVLEKGDNEEFSGEAGKSTAMSLYLSNLKDKLLTKEEEVELSKLAQKGCKKSFNLLMTSNLRLVVKTAKRFKYSKTPMLDLIAEGNLGLYRAVEKFDPDLGYKFSTYAIPWIDQAIRKAIANQDRTVRWPIHFVINEYRYRAYSDKYIANGLDVPCTKIAAKDLDLSESAIEGIKDVYLSEVSLDVGSDDAASFHDTLTDSEDPDSSIQGAYTKELLKVLFAKHLNDRETKVLSLRFGLGCDSLTLDDIGAIFKLTRERIRQIEVTALRKLKSAMVMSGVDPKDLFG